MIAILDFGSQYTQLIARRIRELKIYSEIFPWHISAEGLRNKNTRAVIMSGSPAHIHAGGNVNFDRSILDEFHVLGICYGMQVITQVLGGKVCPGKKREYGKTVFYPVQNESIFAGTGQKTCVWMSHWDYVKRLPAGFTCIGRTDNTEIAAARSANGKIYGLQFHPEVMHTEKGTEMLKNFLYGTCGIKPDWNTFSMLEEAESQIKKSVGNGKVICAMSGGVDSSVLAAMLHKVCGKKALSVFVNNGVMRKGEPTHICRTFKNMVNLKYVDAEEMFLKNLAGVANPERKRKIIGKTFIRIFEGIAEEHGSTFLAQGTLYPDVIESIAPHGAPSAKIKTHHNVGGLPEKLRLSLVEPFKFLFKDEVRQIGRQLGLPASIIDRQPFPGPGLAVRIIGSVNSQRLSILRDADLIVREELQKLDNPGDIWQAFAVLLPVKSVGVMGDKRTYENVIAVRAVKSTDGMTADWADIPHETLGNISARIVNEVAGVNRVVYDITSKPPATIEWE